MRSTHRLQTGLIRFLPAAALLAALFVPFVAASADDDCPPGGCPLPPPQSREVNPAPAHADGSAVEVPKAAELPAVEITVHVLAPAFVEPAPLGTSFEAIDVAVRYQNVGDVSCGVQALGMALDALPGAAPTSASLLGLLQADGMMYDFGTGVEELAYAAESFGYKGSFAFHGASFEQLQTQVSSGSPVVVSLGLNGESAPGHFVTVTGISSDGRWVAYNDPTLGEQVISASEFERLWGLQGNSGVAVATEPAAAAGVDPGMLSLWVAFAAGLMALVSTTPLAKLRQGIGGMLDAGGGGNYTPVRSAPKASPPAKEKEKEKEPKKSKSRFDDEIALPSTPPKATSSVVTTPSEQRASNPGSDWPSEARFLNTYTNSASGDTAIGSVGYSPSRATQGTPREDDKDPEPTPTAVPVATPGKKDIPATILLAETTENDNAPKSTDTPLPEEEDIAAIVTQTPPEPEGYVGVGVTAPPGDAAAILGGTLGLANKLLGLGLKLDAAKSIDITEVDGTLRVFGTRAARETLGFRSMVNWALPENEGLILQSTSTQASGALTSPGMSIALATNIVTDGTRYLSGEYDNTHLAAALTVDTGVTIASAMVAGAIGGAFAGFLVGGALGFGVGAIPAAIAGAVAGALVALGLNYAFTATGARDYVVDSVAGMYGDWTGQD